MHIEKRRAGKRIKYYLAHAMRVDGKVRKIRVYLGTKKENIKEKRSYAEEIIKKRIESYKKISDPFRTVLNSKEIEEIKSLEAKGSIKITHLTEDEWSRFTEAFVYDTNAIEGSTITFSEVRDILQKNEWPRERQKWEISETYGVHDAIDYIRKTKKHISLELIKEIHRIVFKNSKAFAGYFRKKGEEVAVVDAHGRIIHKGAPHHLVTKLLEDLIKWYHKNKNKYPPILLASVVHNQFETIHPFRDGNGRVGRLLLNNILLKHNKPPVNIELRNRKEYYAALRAYQEKGDIRPTIELIIKEYRNLRKIIKRK